jgi:hypothetical protein
MISFKVSDAALKNLERAIARKVAEVTAKAATLAYNTAITYDSPVWSNTFVASWQISVGHSGTHVLEHPTNMHGKPNVMHPDPYVQIQEPVYNSPFTPIYVTNTAKHANLVENIGTPFHPYGGWKIALHSKNQTVQRLRLF